MARICIRRFSEQTTKLTQPEHQEFYASSDGMCLPHLRLALELAAPGAGLQNLLDVTRMRLSALQENLGEFDRKQSWQHKRETVSAAERAATRQAVAFFAGKESTFHDASN